MSSRRLRQRQSGFAAPIAYLDLDHDAPSILRGGRLALRLESRADRETPVARVALDHNFAELVGHCYTITFTALLPDRLVGEDNWLALILEDGTGRTSPRVSPAYSREANFAVLLSQRWQAAARVAGKHIYSTRIFQRDRASGPYQVVLQVDETAPHGPRAWLTVNGREVVRDLPVPLGDGRYLGFHSYLSPPHGEESGYVAIDNLRVSVEPGAKSTAIGNRAFRATNPQP
jgi:hypothetical protein